MDYKKICKELINDYRNYKNIDIHKEYWKNQRIYLERQIEIYKGEIAYYHRLSNENGLRLAMIDHKTKTIKNMVINKLGAISLSIVFLGIMIFLVAILIILK